MLTKGAFWTLVVLGLASLVLAGLNMTLFSQNRLAQADMQARAQYIQQSIQLEPLYREMVKALAEMSMRNNDAQLRDLLAKRGITLSAPPGAPAAQPPMPEPKKGGK